MIAYTGGIERLEVLLTEAGQRRLDEELSSWQRFAGAVNLILAT